MLESNLCE